MKITVGLGQAAFYDRLVDAGADEFFAGYVPLDWLDSYANFTPLNRREVLMQPLQISTAAQLRALARRVEARGVPVAFTFNSASYLPAQFPQIADMLRMLADLGFRDWIIADPALLLHLKNAGVAGRIHLSGEAGCFNPAALRFFTRLGVKRCIFPRKVSPEEMAAMVRSMPGLEYEAFVLNEKCHYSGAFCASLHCDELDHLCKLPYRPFGPNFSVPAADAADPDCFGASGCGLCSLRALADAGVEYLKLVGRGASIAQIERDVRMLRCALDAPDWSPAALKARLFASECGGKCYYPSSFE